MLTEKEIEVLRLRKRGLKQREIAAKLGISQPAVSSFENSIAKKIRDSMETLEMVKGMGVELSKYRKSRK